MIGKYALRWAHLGLARNPRYRDVLETQRRISEELVEEFGAEQEQKNAALPVPSGPSLHISPRYAKGKSTKR